MMMMTMMMRARLKAHNNRHSSEFPESRQARAANWVVSGFDFA
jgi:hypothetical protein